MKTGFILSIVLGTALAIAGGVRAEIVGPRIERAATEAQMRASLHSVKFVDEANRPLDLAAIIASGKPTLVSLWAHWCPICQSELPGFRAIAQACPKRWNIVFVSARHDDYAKDLEKFNRQGLPWPLYNVSRTMLQDGAPYDTYRAFTGATTTGQVMTPLHYFVDTRGQVTKIVNARLDLSTPQAIALVCGGPAPP